MLGLYLAVRASIEGIATGCRLNAVADLRRLVTWGYIFVLHL